MTVRSQRKGRGLTGVEPGPAIILDRTQIGENIGTAARAMLNCGLTEMRLVNPREDWPNEKAEKSAAGAVVVLEGAQLFDTVSDAVGDLTRLYATTARPRDMVKTILTPRAAATEMRAEIALGGRVGLLFGKERSGLENDDVARADAVIEVPLNPDFSSLNLAQAVLVCAYEWRMSGIADLETPRRGREGADPATQKDLEDMFRHLEAELDASGFLYPPEKRPRMVRNIRAMLLRADLTDQEVRTLRGMISSLTRKAQGN